MGLRLMSKNNQRSPRLGALRWSVRICIPRRPRASYRPNVGRCSMPNRLSNETSPYLRQHAENPVDWYPLGEEAFRRPREEDKPIHLSVGYAACHWCHVMAHESFENPEIASLMNERFINIKVDRQDRPD